MAASARPEAVKATHTAATREKVGLEQVETLGKGTPTGQRTEKIVTGVHHHTFECDLSGLVHGRRDIQWRDAVECEHTTETEDTK